MLPEESFLGHLGCANLVVIAVHGGGGGSCANLVVIAVHGGGGGSCANLVVIAVHGGGGGEWGLASRELFYNYCKNFKDMSSNCKT